MTDTVYIVTGCDGFLGSTIVRQLLARDSRVRGVNRTGAAGHDYEVRVADVTDPDALEAAFAGDGDRVVIHTAGKISITGRVAPELWETNVEGTANVIAAARRTGVRRLVYISSVHALPVMPGGTVVEVDHFGEVEGAYATTKAEATRRVLAADDLAPVVIHPSGIVGPGDPKQGHLTQLVRDLVGGQMRAIVPGAEAGSCWLLTGHLVTIKQLAREVARLTGRREPVMMPMWLAQASARLAEAWYRLRGVPPLFTRYSLRTISSGVRYSHAKATRELDYRPRPFAETIRDTVAWIQQSEATTE